MKPYQKHRIGMMRGKGATYAAIAEELGMSENTVKSHCLRQGVASTYEVCPECKNRIVQPEKRKAKRFCSDKCRVSWWAKNPEARNRKAIYNYVCPQCKEPFTAYGNINRKYCSRVCAIAARGKEGNHAKHNH